MTRARAGFWLVLGLALLSGCASTNFDVEQTPSFAIPLSENTSLGRYALNRKQSLGEDESVFFPLTGGSESLGARLRLIDAAEESIDLQYFLMKDDVVGALISARLLKAADRGVRVRFLLDDIFTTVKDVDLFVLNGHENIEVRLFNPIARRGFKYLNYAWNFSSANRRMHNKSLTVDGSHTIVGGRNLAAEYFSLNDDTEFFDLDVLAVGRIAGEVAADFDLYWNFPKALGIEHLRGQPKHEELENARQVIDNAFSSQGASIYRDAINSRLMQQLKNNEVEAYVARTELVSEDPKKLKQSVNDDSLRLIRVIGEFVTQAESEVVIVTPYLIPTDSGMTFFESILAQGIRLRFITNSLASTNHVPVHAAYQKYRKGLLTMGAELYEARGDAFQVRDMEDGELRRTTLHTKLLVIDRRYVFIGSLNLDPRSIVINTEMGLMIDSHALAEELLMDIEDGLDEEAYRLELDDHDRLLWHALERGEVVTYTREPGTSWWRRFSMNFFRVLPEGQL